MEDLQFLDEEMEFGFVFRKVKNMGVQILKVIGGGGGSLERFPVRWLAAAIG